MDKFIAVQKWKQSTEQSEYVLCFYILKYYKNLFRSVADNYVMETTTAQSDVFMIIRQIQP